ncbi:MAG: lycopene cyclase family protein [Alteromonas sp.]
MNTPGRTDVCILGIGLAGCSLALNLIENGYQGRVALYDKAESVNSNKTWCFWDEGSLPDYLRPLIAKRWASWLISSEDISHTHHTTSRDLRYCCIPAEDFYAFALNKLRRAPNVDFYFGAKVQQTNTQSRCLTAIINGEEVESVWGFDSRSQACSDNNNGLLQCFTGAWVKSSTPLFNPEQVKLMSNMHMQPNGLEFTYVLPFTNKYALLELTRFSRQAENLADMREATESLVADTLTGKSEIERWETGILPMQAAPNRYKKPIPHQWNKIGIAGGHIRASTGYAFLTIQKYSEIASRLILGTSNTTKAPVPEYYKWLDRVFLTVIRNNPSQTASLFTRMGGKTNPEQFARFMSESASTSDLLAIVNAMPKRIFLRALWQ